MGSTALQIVSEAYRHHNLNEVTSFGISQEFPYKLAKDILNDVIRTLNRLGSFWFTETKTLVPYSVGISTFSFTALEIDPKRVIRLRKEATDKWDDLKQINWSDFLRRYRGSSIQTANPTHWSKYGSEFSIDTIPDQDYTIYAYHYQDMPLIEAITDTFLVPERDEDILIDGCYQMLGYKMGRWDLPRAVAAIQLKAQPFLVDMKQDAGIPSQMPAAF